jgi:hypothetical protein
MRLNRNAVAVVLLAVLLSAVAPAVQAVPLAKPQTSTRLLGTDWISAALTWLGHLFSDRTPQAPASQQKGDTRPPTGVIPNLGGNGTFAGSCIDPNGCLDGGSGG